MLLAAPLPGGLAPVADPSRLGAWWSIAGPVNGCYGAARILLAAISAIWAGLVAMRSAVAGTRIGAALASRLVARAATGTRRAGLAGVLRLVLGLSVSGAGVSGCALGSRAASASGTTTPTPAATGAGPSALPAPLLVSKLPAPSPDRGQPAPSSASPLDRRPAAPAPMSPAQTAATTAPPESGAARYWTVRPGDDLWSIAVSVTSGAGSSGRPDVARYWQALIAANLSRLPVPADPSLIFPGDELILPPIAAPGGTTTG